MRVPTLCPLARDGAPPALPVDAPRSRPLVLVTGGKGGVGKSTLAANLGILLAMQAEEGTNPLLVDLDLGLANLNVDRHQSLTVHIEELTPVAPPAGRPAALP